MVRTENTIDQKFLLYITVLMVVGLAALMSASGPLGFGKFHDSYFFVKRQIFFGLIPGLVLGYFILKLNLEKLRNLSWVPYLGAVLLLALVFVPGVGLVINGAKSWINIFGYNFQPSEVAKLGLIIFAAYLLSDRKRNLQDWQMGLMPILTLLAPVILLVAVQPDIGTLSIMIVILFFINSFDRVFAKLTTPVRNTFDKTSVSAGSLTTNEVILIILPHLFFFI